MAYPAPEDFDRHLPSGGLFPLSPFVFVLVILSSGRTSPVRAFLLFNLAGSSLAGSFKKNKTQKNFEGKCIYPSC